MQLHSRMFRLFLILLHSIVKNIRIVNITSLIQNHSPEKILVSDKHLSQVRHIKVT